MLLPNNRVPYGVKGRLNIKMHMLLLHHISIVLNIAIEIIVIHIYRLLYTLCHIHISIIRLRFFIRFSLLNLVVLGTAHILKMTLMHTFEAIIRNKIRLNLLPKTTTPNTILIFRTYPHIIQSLPIQVYFYLHF